MRHREERIGDCTLILGDSCEILRGLKGVADLVVTDPPYRLTSGGSGSRAMGGIFAPDRYDNSGDLMRVMGWPEMAAPIFDCCKPDADTYVMANDKNIFAAHAAFTTAGYRLHNLLTWRKGAPTRNRWYMKDTEYVLYLWKGRARTINDPGAKQSFDCPRPKDPIHPTQKPVELYLRYILNSSRPGDLVLDPFSGSGTCLEACLRSGRKGIAIDVDPDHFERSLRRLRAIRDTIDAAGGTEESRKV